MRVSQKTILLLGVAICCHYHEIQAETKVLRNISFDIHGGFGDETISLENDKDLVAEGFQVQRFSLPNDPNHELTIIINYIGDKEGYRAKYILTREEATPGILRLDPSTFKSLGG